MAELLHHISNTDPGFFHSAFESMPKMFYVSSTSLEFDNIGEYSNNSHPKLTWPNMARRRIPKAIFDVCKDYELSKAEVKIQGSTYPTAERGNNWSLLIFLAYSRRPKFLQNRHLLEELDIDRLERGTNLVISPGFNTYQANKLIEWFNLLKQPQQKRPINIPDGTVWIETNPEEPN